MKYQLQITKSGHKTIRFEFEKKMLNLNSIYDPIKEANIKYKKILELNNAPEYFMLVGTDFFYFLNSIINDKNVYNNLKKIYIVEYWQELLEISIKESPYSILLNDIKVVKFFNTSLTDIIETLNSDNVNFNNMTILLSNISGTIWSKNKKFFEFFKEKILVKVPGDIFFAINKIKNNPAENEFNDITAIILLMNEMVTKIERKDMNYELL